MSPDDPSPPPAAERRLDEHLELLRQDEGTGDRALAHRVVRTARWQRAVRVPLQVVASIAGAAIDGLRTLVVGRRGSPR
jgi:hypothetical protein